jgi:pimeloyl-ACP methyl ester carboxylesterase
LSRRAFLLAPLLALLIACSGSKPAATPTVPAATETPSSTATPSRPAATPTFPAPPAPATLSWRGCGGGNECSSISVPLDYANPTGRQIDLALIRRRAGGTRIGSLVVNFGGPGASGVDFFPGWVGSLPSEIKQAFDLVSFDPRGVDQLHCGEDMRVFGGINPFPQTQTEWQQVDQAYAEYATKCMQNGDGILPFLGTANAARDLDQIRIALGDEKLTYLGYSYGTELGAIYATLFPDHVRALVLDGVVDTTLNGDDSASQQAQGFQGAVDHYIASCKASACIPSFRDDPLAAIQEVIRRSQAAPIPSRSADRPAGVGEVVLGIQGAMYSPSEWPGLTRALNNALAGDGSGLVNLADDDSLYRNPDGSYPNIYDVYYATSCLDTDFIRDTAHYQALAQELAPLIPLFATSFTASGLVCAHWPVATQPLPPPTAHGAPPLLLVGTTGDPATPYVWATAMAKKVESNVLLTFNGDGHTAYGRGNNCVTSAVDAYFLTLVLPPPGTVCGDPALAAPIAVNTTPLPTPAPTKTP